MGKHNQRKTKHSDRCRHATKTEKRIAGIRLKRRINRAHERALEENK
jgi:hypothetical protein